MVFCLMPVLTFTVDAATVNYVYDGEYVYNWGTREETATFLSPMAEDFYEENNVTYAELAALSGSSSVGSVPSSELYKKLQTLMKGAHKYETSYNATRPLYMYTDCQQSGKWQNGKISSFYSGDPIGPAWDSGNTWNREHTWPNSKGDASGNGENDIMMLRPTAKSENGSRSNKAYGKSSGYYNPNMESGGSHDVRGDVARIMLFVYCRWGNTGSMWGSSGVIESKDVLLEWAEADPVDTWELGRNDSTETITGTRNVFVDYPELIFVLFGEEIPANMPTPSGNALCKHTETVIVGFVAATCSAEGYTGDTRCKSCNTKLEAGEAIPKVPHTFATEVTPPSCTEDGFTFYICSVCDHMEEDDYVDALGHDMGEWATVKDATCTEDGEKQRQCSRCNHFETETIEKSHDMGQWIVTREPTPDAAGEERSDCSRCDHFETRTVEYQGNVLKLEGEEFADQDTVWIEGLPYPVEGTEDNRYVVPPVEGDFIMVTYTYHVGDAADVHTQYPSGMKVYEVSNGTIKHIPELDDLLRYSGSSIRITGNKGIRMITSLTKESKTALTGEGLAGYKLLEYGTTLCLASEIPEGDALVLDREFTRHNHAYKKGVADPVFATSGNLTQYTNVLVGFSLDQCKEDIAMRPYIILENAEGEQITLYGGTIYRSIGYIAYQNRTVFKPKTASYNYVWEIIHHVYGDQYDADYKG
jgi:endonuclease I